MTTTEATTTRECASCTVPTDRPDQVCTFCRDYAPPLPPGADFGDLWETGDDTARVISSPNCGVTDHAVIVWCDAEQLADGTLTKPLCRIDINWDTDPLNSDQARELAALLLEAASLLDGWAMRRAPE